jgi:hypothetical protein
MLKQHTVLEERRNTFLSHQKKCIRRIHTVLEERRIHQLRMQQFPIGKCSLYADYASVYAKAVHPLYVVWSMHCAELSCEKTVRSSRAPRFFGCR